MSQIQVCRTCLQVIENQNSCVNLDASDTNPNAFEIKSKLEACVPELTISVVKNPVICGQCIASLNTAFAFKRKCVDAEERIYDLLLDIDSNVVNLDLLVVAQDVKCKIEVVEDEAQTNMVYTPMENGLNGAPSTSQSPTEIQTNEELHPVIGTPNGAFHKPKQNGILDSQPEIFVNPSSFPACFISLLNLSEEFLKIFKGDDQKLKNTLIKEAHSKDTDRFICFICDKNFETRKQFKEHKITHGSQAIFYICYPYEVDRESIKMHLYEKVSKTSKRYQCGVCFSNIHGSVNSHLRLHMNKDLRKCRFCKLCSIHKARQKRRKPILAQENKPSGKRKVVEKFVCDKCEFSAVDKNLLIKHVKTHKKTVPKEHLEKPKKPKLVKHFSCDKCGFLTVDEDLLKKHVKTHVKSPLKRPFWKCSLCRSNISSAKELIKHVAVKHRGDNIYKCGFCDFVINKVDRLKCHMRIHNGMKRYNCLLCKFKTYLRSEFSEHTRIHSILLEQAMEKSADNAKP